jgi:hypothetical protein
LPGGIGGDGYKYLCSIKHIKLQGKKVFWAIMFDRLSGLWAIGLITVALIFLIPQIDIHIGIPQYFPGTGIGIYYFVAYKFFKEYTKFFFQAHLKAVIAGACSCWLSFCNDGAGFYRQVLAIPVVVPYIGPGIIIPITVGGAGIRETVFHQIIKVFPMDKGLAVFCPSSFYLISLLVAYVGYLLCDPPKPVGRRFA